jgi:nucleoside-diphosphate-sugar epimerase
MQSPLYVITGATGHIGYALLKKLEARGARVRILIRKDTPVFDGIECEKAYGDVTDPDSLLAAFEGADESDHTAEPDVSVSGVTDDTASFTSQEASEEAAARWTFEEELLLANLPVTDPTPVKHSS